MGWSCTKAASDVMQAWSNACRAQTGTSNTYTVGNDTYFFEVSRTEHADGAITGSVMKKVAAPTPTKVVTVPSMVEQALGIAQSESFWARKAGSFRINGDGTIARAPAFLKAARV
jgi:hypothetical protein